MPISGERRIGLVSLLKIEFADHELRLCDGGFIDFDGERYLSADSVFGSLGGFQVAQERAGDEAADAMLTLLPPQGTAAGVLNDSGHQGSRVRFWLVEYDLDTGEAVDATADQLASMRVDVPTLRLMQRSKALDLDLMDAAMRLFLINRGNVLSPRFHRSIWPDEAGMDNMTGTPRQVAWGVQGPARGSVQVSGGGANDYGPVWNNPAPAPQLTN